MTWNPGGKTRIARPRLRTVRLARVFATALATIASGKWCATSRVYVELAGRSLSVVTGRYCSVAVPGMVRFPLGRQQSY